MLILFYDQIELLKIDPATPRVRKVSQALIFTINLVSFFLFQFLSGYIVWPIRENIKMKPIQATILFFNVFLYQNNILAYIMMLFVIYYRLSALIESIDYLNKENQEFSLKDLRFSMIFLDKVCDTLDMLTTCYTVSSIVYLTHFIFHLTFTAYGIISYSSRNDLTYVDFIFVFLTSIWQAYNFPFVISILIFSYLIPKKGKEVETAVNNILLKSSLPNIKFHTMVQTMSLQSFHRQPVIDYGIFEINWKLVFSALASSISYLVIIVQFELLNV